MNTEVQSSINSSELATLLIPMAGQQLVLPNVTVAEIIPYISPEQEEGKPDWFLGNISWRNSRVPLVSFEGINLQNRTITGSNRRIAVLNGLVDDQILPFCGLLIQGVPRLMRIAPNEVATVEGRFCGPATLAIVQVSGEEAVIPNVDFIQNEVMAVL